MLPEPGSSASWAQCNSSRKPGLPAALAADASGCPSWSTFCFLSTGREAAALPGPPRQLPQAGRPVPPKQARHAQPAASVGAASSSEHADTAAFVLISLPQVATRPPWKHCSRKLEKATKPVSGLPGEAAPALVMSEALASAIFASSLPSGPLWVSTCLPPGYLGQPWADFWEAIAGCWA